jgi:hypothetical protein
MHHFEKYIDRAPYREPVESGYQWTIRNLEIKNQCYNMFRMHRNVFDSLHNVLIERYGLKSTRKMTSTEAFAMFLWMCGSQ